MTLPEQTAPDPNERKFKGWTRPGPVITSLATGTTVDAVTPAVTPDVTKDALSGYYKIFQLKEGHRFSTDDILVPWFASVQAPCVQSVLDLGSGLGTVAMILAFKYQGAHFTTVEAQQVSYDLSQRSVHYNQLESRFSQHLGDLREFKSDQKFDLITSSPPYFPEEAGHLPEHAQKQACRFEVRGTIGDYAQVAAKFLGPAGLFVTVFPIEPCHQLARVISAHQEAGLKIVRQRFVRFKEGEKPILGLFASHLKGDLPESKFTHPWQDPDLTIRLLDGSVSPEYQAIKLSIGFPP